MVSPLDRALRALDGLSVGDAFGERFFLEPAEAYARIRDRELPEGPWRWTDDTQMALSVVEVLEAHGRIDQDALAAAFARRHDPSRGYGAGAHEILRRVREGEGWRRAARAAFRGQGSFGNGGAMRVAPLGAWFAGDLDRCAEEARASAEVTHAHEEGMAGAVAIAVAAAILVEEPAISASALLDATAARTPRGYTREGIEAARRLPAETGMVDAAVALGNGSGVSAPDTVPLCLFVAAHVRDDYREAMWRTVSALGDRDTTCAIVGGLLAAAGTPLPEEWLSRREPLDHISAGITSMR